ncbi:winged helix-turn-helix domain-containing protein [Streptomyces sp. NPDC048659]|uniref:winged helix-turn-helix domain-containing protein n=1 Tax=Streptomyces sp. NPDC048659 TaxID=3155489 RepID=UPI003446EE11
MRIHDAEDVQYLLRKTGAAKLNPNQRIVVMLYAASPQKPDGTVETQATELAKIAGMSPPVLSRTRRELVDAGWLEPTQKFGRVQVYRLVPAIFTDRGRAGRHLQAVSG